MSKAQKEALRFANKYRGWQGFHGDYKTRQVIHALANRGFVELDLGYDQFRISDRGIRAAEGIKR